MKLETEHTSFEGPSLGRLLHLATFVGAALVILGMAAAVAANYLDSDGGAAARAQAKSATSVTSSATFPKVRDLPPMTFFLVDSLGQHDSVFLEESERANARAQAGEEERWFTVLLAGTLEQEKEAWDHIEETKRTWGRCCRSSAMNTIDLRPASNSGQVLLLISE
jgi:hypothetical protein